MVPCRNIHQPATPVGGRFALFNQKETRRDVAITPGLMFP
jgi:hypothetical protein